MGLRAPKVLENDALVVLCFSPEAGPRRIMSHWQFRLEAKSLGFNLTQSQAHNMLHRARGRLLYDAASHFWHLTAQGIEYRRHVLQTAMLVVRREGSVSVWGPEGGPT